MPILASLSVERLMQSCGSLVYLVYVGILPHTFDLIDLLASFGRIVLRGWHWTPFWVRVDT